MRMSMIRAPSGTCSWVALKVGRISTAGAGSAGPLVAR